MIEKLLLNAIIASFKAGCRVLEIYNSEDFKVEFKEDASPLTTADKEAHRIIKKHLETTNIPVLSEEGKNIDYSERKNWNQMWLVDPIDGTKEFISRNGEFTINIALIENQISVLGVVYAPVTGEFFFGSLQTGAYKTMQLDTTKDYSTCSLYFFISVSEKLPYHTKRDQLTVVGSRSHMNEETQQFINNLPGAVLITRGSSLKLCMIAEGKADIYPRFGTTMEWDIAAGHAVISSAGGNVCNWYSGKELIYNKKELQNQHFIAKSAFYKS